VSEKYFPKEVWALTAMDGLLEKQVPRLEAVLPTNKEQASKLRHDMALAMLRDVVKALKGSKYIGDHILIISPDQRIREEVAQEVVFRQLQNVEKGLNAAFDEGSQWLAENKRADALLFIAPDLPLVTATAINRLIESDDGNSQRTIILCPSRGGGTTVIYKRPITLDFNPQYTNPTTNSQTFRKHCIEAKRVLNGRPPLLFDSFVFSTDIDVEEDLIELEVHGQETETWEIVRTLLAYHGPNNRDYYFSPSTHKSGV